MPAAKKYDEETQARAVRMYVDRLAESGATGVLWVLWTLLKNGISRLLSGVGSILGGRGWVCGTLTLSGVVL